MIEALNIFVRGEPAPQPRPAAQVRPGAGGKMIAHIYTPTTRKDVNGERHPLAYVAWKRQIQSIARSMRHPTKLAGPLRVDIDFYFRRPDYLLTAKSPVGAIPHAIRPDVDNLAKAVYDALGEADVWEDDGQICCGEVTKQYAGKGDATGARIVISHLVAPDLVLFDASPRVSIE